MRELFPILNVSLLYGCARVSAITTAVDPDTKLCARANLLVEHGSIALSAIRFVKQRTKTRF